MYPGNSTANLSSITLNLSTTPTTGAGHNSPDVAALIWAAVCAWHRRDTTSSSNTLRTAIEPRDERIADKIIQTGVRRGIYTYNVTPAGPQQFGAGSSAYTSEVMEGFVLKIARFVSGANTTINEYFIPFASVDPALAMTAIVCAQIA